MTRWMLWAAAPALAGVFTWSAAGQQVAAESFVLDNGMEFLLVPRRDEPNNIAAGWLARVGSVNERPGITGLSHFFEHLMFKGTSTIGTTDAARDAALAARQHELRHRLNALIWSEQYERWRRGEVLDPWDPAEFTDEMTALRAALRAAMDEQREVVVKDEFSTLYSRIGGSQMNAFTSHDLTFFIVTIPSNKIEFWAWMESDRLSDAVFREFYAERDVVHEERRQRIDSTPTGEFNEQLDAMFWQSSPYAFPVIGWPSDLNSYSIEDARRHWNTYYRANNLVGVIVGDFDPAVVKPMLREYFGRLEAADAPPPPVVTLEVPQHAEMRLLGSCDCPPQVEIRYHSVPFNHPDAFALDVLAEILNGRTGRLYARMVDGADAIATNVGAGQDSRRYAGSFSFSGEARGDTPPEKIEQAWYEEVNRLQNQPVASFELERVKNRLVANSYRRLRSNFALMIQLGYFEALGGWEYLNESTAKQAAVTAEDIMRVARTYLVDTNRTVAVFTRASGTQEDADLAQFPPALRPQIKQMLGRLLLIETPGECDIVLSGLRSQMDNLPSEHKPALEYVLQRLREHKAALEADAPEGK
ncbi:MAG: insulinase family protein [Phycisphaerales bacterium]|nr:insulinase family protein [Phycisphaerales bacterium]